MVLVKYCNKCTGWLWLTGLVSGIASSALLREALAVNRTLGSTLNAKEKCLKFPIYLWWVFISKPYM